MPKLAKAHRVLLDRASKQRDEYWGTLNELTKTAEPAFTAFFDALGVEEAWASVDDHGNRELTLEFKTPLFGTFQQDTFSGDKSPASILEAIKEQRDTWGTPAGAPGMKALRSRVAAALKPTGWSVAGLGELMEITSCLPLRRNGWEVSLEEMDVPALG